MKAEINSLFNHFRTRWLPVSPFWAVGQYLSLLGAVIIIEVLGRLIISAQGLQFRSIGFSCLLVMPIFNDLRQFLKGREIAWFLPMNILSLPSPVVTFLHFLEAKIASVGRRGFHSVPLLVLTGDTAAHHLSKCPGRGMSGAMCLRSGILKLSAFKCFITLTLPTCCLTATS